MKNHKRGATTEMLLMNIAKIVLAIIAAVVFFIAAYRFIQQYAP